MIRQRADNDYKFTIRDSSLCSPGKKYRDWSEDWFQSWLQSRMFSCVKGLIDSYHIPNYYNRTILLTRSGLIDFDITCIFWSSPELVKCQRDYFAKPRQRDNLDDKIER